MAETFRTSSAFLQRIYLPLALAVLLAGFILLYYFSTSVGMVSIWQRSETFAHGFVVGPIALWLMWRNRARLAIASFTPAWWVLLIVAAGGFIWLLGQVASAAVVSQVGLVVMLTSAIWAQWGSRAAKVVAFPLLFLFFAVPAGEVLLPTLMQHTADFTVAALKFSGIPVYREGLSFVIPSGNWSVVEACSGIRYLIASFMVGMLFAYLNYRSLTRRLCFVVASLAVPIVANWLRAYMIVMLGHLSGNRIATGVDHIIYGWVFFGLVIIALFWVGSFWREEERPDPSAAEFAQASSQSIKTSSMLLICTVIVGLIVIWKPVASNLLKPVVEPPKLLHVPAALPGWDKVDPFVGSGWRPTYEGARSTLKQAYRKDGVVVTLYIAFYKNQTEGHELVQWDNRLTTAEDRAWFQVDGGSDTFSTDRKSIVARYNEIRGTLERALVWHWLWLDDKTSVSDSEAKLLLAKDRLLRQSDDSAAVFVYASKGEDAQKVKKITHEFVQDYWPYIVRELRVNER